MEANEFRINNIVENPYGTSIIYGISNDCVQITLKNSESVFDFDFEDIKPIILTEDLLLKCGFDSFGSRWMKKELPLDLINCDGFYMANVKEEIKYLHQLQNIYFILTNKELEISL